MMFFYSPEQAEEIDKVYETLRSTPKKDISLCQYNGNSCARCCLPHIGGDHPHELPKEERINLFNKDNLGFHAKYDGRYVGPNNLIMKFDNISPLGKIGFSGSGYEDSFKDVGRKEMEKRFSGRRKLFKKTFEPNAPKSSIKSYMRKIKQREAYTYEMDKSSALANFFIGGPSLQNTEKDKLPECHLLGFTSKDNKKVGCLGHKLCEFSQGYDSRKVEGFFKKTDSCTRVTCEAGEEFPYLSDSALKVFDKAIGNLSWYDYSRHSTAVLVSYLRAYDHVIQMLDKKEKLDKLSLEGLVSFTNDLFDDWDFKENRWYRKCKLNDIQLPIFPVSKKIGQGQIEYFIGNEGDSKALANISKKEKAANNKWHKIHDLVSKKRSLLRNTSCEEYRIKIRSELEDLEKTKEKTYNELRILGQEKTKFRQKVMPKLPYEIISRENGYQFLIDTPQEKMSFYVDIKNGNKPVFKRKGCENLQKIILDNYLASKNPITAAKSEILSEIHTSLTYPEDKHFLGETITGNEILLKTNLPVSERILYSSLKTVFFMDHFDEQLSQARKILEEKVDQLQV